MKYSYDYICEPRRITIQAKSAPHNSKGITITFFVDDKEAHTIYSQLSTYSPTQSDISEHVAKYCSRIKRLTEEKIQNECDEDNIMRMLYVKRFLTKVQKKSGTTIWKL